MSGIKQGLGVEDLLNIIDRLKTIFRSDTEKDFLIHIKSYIISEGDRFSVKQFTDRIQRESEILHELARTIQWGEQQSKSDDWKFHE